jgi:hypothetical protein
MHETRATVKAWVENLCEREKKNRLIIMLQPIYKFKSRRFSIRIQEMTCSITHNVTRRYTI